MGAYRQRSNKVRLAKLPVKMEWQTDMEDSFTQRENFEKESAGNTSTNFSYTDPVDGTVSKNQRYIFKYADGSRFVFKKSGKGSSGAIIRVYLEKYSTDIN
jgi:phosphoglucomutase